MQIEVHRSYTSTRPPDDAHPYRSGAWRPQTTEYNAWDLDVDGRIPNDLAGTYLRNTENPLLDSLGRYHPFDGDGMLHAITFVDGEASYRNRFVRTDGLAAELEAREPLWAGLAERPTKTKVDYGWGARGLMKDASSTDVTVHRGLALSSFYMCGELYRLDPATLTDEGRETWRGRFPAEGVSAHPKVDPRTGELLFFNYGTEAPYMHYGVVSDEGELVHYTDIPLPGSRLPHDMAFTENYVILNDFPLYWDPEALAAGHYVNRMHDEPSRFAVVPRRGTAADIMWFEADPTFVLHWNNAYEDADGRIVLDGFFQENPAPAPRPDLTTDENIFRYLDLYTMGSKIHRWTFDPATGHTSEEHLDERILEFPAINPDRAGLPYRYAYYALPCSGWFGFEGFAKHDLHTGEITTVAFPAGVFGSEAVVVPRPGSGAEDDAYLLTYLSDCNADASTCAIYDAADITAGPLATVALPERIS
ncbi:MAG: apocarotenoid-15,15'-oxygenase, partial [Acidimicrobiales bacterium]|nr:apocarotenoid-15,15'-oxygenase [Acidimicrobiales bacterium]